MKIDIDMELRGWNSQVPGQKLWLQSHHGLVLQLFWSVADAECSHEY